MFLRNMSQIHCLNVNSEEKLTEVGEKAFEKAQDYTAKNVSDLCIADFESLISN